MVVGVNRFAIDDEPLQKLEKVDLSVGEDQERRLREIKKKRDGKLVEKCLDELAKAAEDESVNLIPFILEAVKAYASLGEICGVMRKVFGEYRPPSVL